MVLSKKQKAGLLILSIICTGIFNYGQQLHFELNKTFNDLLWFGLTPVIIIVFLIYILNHRKEGSPDESKIKKIFKKHLVPPLLSLMFGWSFVVLFEHLVAVLAYSYASQSFTEYVTVSKAICNETSKLATLEITTTDERKIYLSTETCNKVHPDRLNHRLIKAEGRTCFLGRLYDGIAYDSSIQLVDAS